MHPVTPVPLPEQVTRYRRFRDEVTTAELEQFFRRDARALDMPAGKTPSGREAGVGGPGPVRMLGTFLTEGPWMGLPKR